MTLTAYPSFYLVSAGSSVFISIAKCNWLIHNKRGNEKKKKERGETGK